MRDSDILLKTYKEIEKQINEIYENVTYATEYFSDLDVNYFENLAYEVYCLKDSVDRAKSITEDMINDLEY